MTREEQRFREILRDATIIDTEKTLRKNFSAVKSEWICKYIGVKCGNIHECYIGEKWSGGESAGKLKNSFLERRMRSKLVDGDGFNEDEQRKEEIEELRTVKHL